MRLTLVSLIALVIALVQLAASADANPPTRSEELDALIHEYEAAMNAYLDLPNAQRGTSPWKTYPARFFELAKSQPDDASLRACEYIILKFYIAKERYAAIDLATDHHLDKSLFGQFLGNLVYKYDNDNAVDECLKKVAKSTNVTAQIHAAYQRARLMIDRRNWCLDGDIERYEGTFDETQVAAFYDEHAANRIAALLEEVIDSNPQVPYVGKPLVEWAKQDLFEIQHLETGCRSPVIDGRDSNGKSFRLSDYRGNVVVVTFWAAWCGPCMADLPHEIAFVESMKGRPMVWLGVNGDADVDRLRKIEEEKNINFRSWHDGKDGPIAKLLAVRGWPTMYVVDQNGIIRYKSRKSVELDQATKAIESLVAQAERAKGITNR